MSTQNKLEILQNGRFDRVLYGNVTFSIVLQFFNNGFRFSENLFLKNLFVKSRKFYVRRNNNKADSIETGRRVIAHLLP